MSHASPLHFAEHRAHLVASEHDRQALGLAGARDAAEVPELVEDDVAVQEQERRERLRSASRRSRARRPPDG